MKPQHTPTPWNLGSFGEIVSGPVMTVTGGDLMQGKLICKMDDWRNNQANAAFIVRAVNTHDGLLNALKELRQTEGKSNE